MTPHPTSDLVSVDNGAQFFDFIHINETLGCFVPALSLHLVFELLHTLLHRGYSHAAAFMEPHWLTEEKLPLLIMHVGTSRQTLYNHPYIVAPPLHWLTK